MNIQELVKEYNEIQAQMKQYKDRTILSQMMNGDDYDVGLKNSLLIDAMQVKHNIRTHKDYTPSIRAMLIK